MPSSSTDTRRPFLPVGAGAWVRLGLVAALGVGAVVAPTVDRTGAIYTDVEAAEGFTVYGPAPEPTPTPTETAPEPVPTDPATTDPTLTDPALSDPAVLDAPAPAALLATTVPTSEAVQPSPDPTATPAPAATAAEPTAPLPTPWLSLDKPRRHGR